MQPKRRFGKIFIFALLGFWILVKSASAQNAPLKPLAHLSKAQIDSLLRVTAQQGLTITERMAFYSALFLGTPYEFTCVGDGQDALFEPYPLVNFRKTNCMALCEHVLALAISDSWDNFFNNLQHIRYRDGIIGMRTRNHYTMADWLPENRWLLQDVSRKVAGSKAKRVTRTISHKTFFKKKGIRDLRYVLPDRKITIDYIPSEVLAETKPKLKSGDIGAIIYRDKPDIFSAHMFLLVDKNGMLTVREASTSKMTTFDTPFEKWAQNLIAKRRYLGVAIMRVRDELDIPNKIILPWEIPELKAKVQK